MVIRRLITTALCAVAVVAPAAPAALGVGTTRGTITATDGEQIEFFTHGNPVSPSLIISPAFTGSAALYVNRFGTALPEWYVVGV